MSAVPDICFDKYLKSLVTEYKQWWRLYTLTDATSRESQRVETEQIAPTFFDFGLMVQTVQQPEQGQESEQARDKQEKKEKIERLPVLEGICKYAAEHVLLVGRPGSGKSTALARLLLEESQKAIENRHAKIPVLVELRYLPSEANESSVIERIRAFFLKHDPALDLDVSAIENLLRQGRLLLLVDGVNELPSDRGRTQVINFRELYQKTCPMIFTTRELSAGGDLGIAKRLEMQPLTEPQMQQFVMAYLPTQGERLLRQLSGRLREFGQTPLLLWMLCSLFQQSEQIPPNLGMVFRAFTVGYGDRIKQDVTLSKDSRAWWGRLLQYLAFKMTCGENLTELQVAISRRDAEQFLVEFLRGKVEFADDCAVRWLEDLLKHHLIQISNDRIEFRHQLIQEYYAAEWLLGLLPSLSDARLQQSYLNYLKWTESLALMLELVESEEQAVRVVSLALKVDLQLGARLAGAVKQEFQDKTVKLVENLETTTHVKIALLEKTQSNQAFNGLREALNHPELDIRRRVAWALKKMPYDVVIPLSKIALEDSDPKVRENMVWALSESKNELAIPILNTVLQKDLSVDVRQRAVYALQEFVDEEVILVLLKATEDFERNINESVIYALEKLDRQKVITTLSRALYSQDVLLKISVVKIFKKLGGEVVVPHLITATLDLNQKVHLEAVCSLRLVKHQIASQVQKNIESALFNPETQRKREHEKCITDLKAVNPIQRGNAILHLDIFIGRDAIPIVIQALDDPDRYVRSRACNVLAARLIPKFPEAINIFREAISKLIQIIEDKDPSFCSEAVSALGQLGDKQACSSLLKAMRYKEPETRRNAIEALIKLGCQEIKTELLKALKDSNSLVRSSAAHALGAIQCKEAISELINLLKDHDVVAQSSVSGALSQFQKDTAAEYLPQLVGLIGTDIGERSLHAISSIQARCKYYNYNIAQTPLPPEDHPNPSTGNTYIFKAPVGQVVENLTVQRDNIATQNNQKTAPES